ncbi:helix-turn-helix domain-containing protein [Polyangium aurulentum]|uniref:helix-turn-helix domain-containing protein n=1 Tax=Polyangium aurulentum TaxID=2567896 RepID=UPI00146E0240|nr:helix-turn-helix transcriptional regulator [Polyangium aurulentum]UQA63449.1 helix-turn-helix domain-containing protein [Polyangium aurulentum]
MPRRPNPEPVAAKVGTRIRDLRQERGMSLAALADASGLSKGHMSSVERGLVLITVGTVVSAARALGVPPFVLLMFPEEEPLAAVIEHVRLSEGGDPDKAAAALRKIVFGQAGGKTPKLLTSKAVVAKSTPKAATKAPAGKPAATTRTPAARPAGKPAAPRAAARTAAAAPAVAPAPATKRRR